MNIHPLFVHFPIALLTVYAVMEFLRFKALKNNSAWFYVKTAFLLLGTAAGYVTLLTGETAKHLIRTAQNRALINAHSNWAVISVFIYSILSLGYLIAWAERLGFSFTPLSKLKWLIIETPLVWLLALAGVIAILITGALGGTIVYGLGNDPVTDFIYHLFF